MGWDLLLLWFAAKLTKQATLRIDIKGSVPENPICSVSCIRFKIKTLDLVSGLMTRHSSL